MCFSCVSIAFSKDNRYTILVQEQFAEKFPETPVPHHSKIAVYRDRPRTLNELKTAITVYVRNISQADLQKVFVNEIKGFWPVWMLVDITSNIFYKCTVTFQTHYIS